MSETPKKRSRKSKLVPRECAVDIEDDVQIPVYKLAKNMKHSEIETEKNTPTTSGSTEICKNTSTEMNTNPAVPSAPLQFHINVEIEQCDEYVIRVLSNDKQVTLSSEINGTKKASVKEIPNPIKSKTPKDSTSESEENDSELGNLSSTKIATKIIETTKEIAKKSTNIADKILDICVRNTIGYEINSEIEENFHDKSIQKALELWRYWQIGSFHRESPLFYKCYICKKSWWYLSDFRNHIVEHLKLDICLETYEKHEANIIAHNIPRRKVKRQLVEFHTEGLCPTCGRDYNSHRLSNRIPVKFHSNHEKCKKKFFTCSGLINHMKTCENCKNKNENFKCCVCMNCFDNEELLNTHLEVCHTVRTDVPIHSHFKTCTNCDSRYIQYSLHACGRGETARKCNYCYRYFNFEAAVEIHMENSNNPYTCEICSVRLLRSCMKYEHMLLHTVNYIMVHKCLKCKDFKVFLSNEAAMAHQYWKHRARNDNDLNYFAKVIIPKSCYTSVEESKCSESQIKPKLESDSKCESETGAVTFDVYQHIKIKEEPKVIADTTQFIIKEEPTDDYEIDTPTDKNTNNSTNTPTDYNPEINIKEEYDEFEIEEYEDDIIKLDFDIENHLLMVKQEPNDTQESNDYTHESEDSQESIVTITESVNESEDRTILKSETIKSGRKRTKQYTCTKCGFTARHSDYRLHIETDCPKTSKPKSFICTKCNNNFNSMKKYLTHFVHHGYNLLSCPECLMQFYVFTKLTGHVQMHIKQNYVRVKCITFEDARYVSDYQCKKCSEFVEPDKFFEHWETHVNDAPQKPKKPEPVPEKRKLKKVGNTGGNYQLDSIDETVRLLQLERTNRECNQCPRRFKRYNESKRHLIEHLLSHAFSEKLKYGELRCQICTSGFPTPEKYKHHMRDHASLPVYMCGLCDRTFSDSSNFTKHKKVHNLKVLICDICGKKFKLKQTLEKHMELHRTTKPITCTPCDKVFYFATTYRRHVRYCHERNAFGYRCMNCRSRFDTLKEKWVHMWDVHKERKHRADCPICFKSFRKYQDVRIHAKRDHNTDVSMYSVKNAAAMIDTKIKHLMEKSPEFGNTETLVVFE